MAAGSLRPSIALAEPGADFLRIVATAGPTAEMSRTLKLADHGRLFPRGTA